LAHWFPGHMARAKREVAENIKLVDAVFELVDARVAESSRNPDLEELLEGRPRILLLTKSDLADPRHTEGWVEFWSRQGLLAVAVNAVTGEGLRRAVQLAKNLGEERQKQRAQRLLRPRPLRIMVVGIPNVGKSSLINYLARRARTRVADRPGVTRGKQWIKLEGEAEFLDLPGLLPPRGLGAEQAHRLAAVGTLPEGTFDLVETALWLLAYLAQAYPELLQERYGLAESAATAGENCGWNWLQTIGKKRGFLVAGGAVDEEKAARAVLRDFRTGALGRISLEAPPVGEKGDERGYGEGH